MIVLRRTRGGGMVHRMEAVIKLLVSSVGRFVCPPHRNSGQGLECTVESFTCDCITPHTLSLIDQIYTFKHNLCQLSPSCCWSRYFEASIWSCCNRSEARLCFRRPMARFVNPLSLPAVDTESPSSRRSRSVSEGSCACLPGPSATRW